MGNVRLFKLRFASGFREVPTSFPGQSVYVISIAMLQWGADYNWQTCFPRLAIRNGVPLTATRVLSFYNTTLPYWLPGVQAFAWKA